MDARTQQMLSAPALPLLARMAAPSTVAFFIQGSVSLAEVWFVGSVGEDFAGGYRVGVSIVDVNPNSFGWCYGRRGCSLYRTRIGCR